MPSSLSAVEYVEAHPLRGKILELAAAVGAASPVQIAGEVEWPLGVVAYHVRCLAARRLLAPSTERRVRGAVEHFYRLTPAGEAALSARPVAVAVRALETIVERYQDGHLESIPSVAGEALRALGRTSENGAAG